MVFNSLAFLAFFPVVVLLHFALPRPWRWPLLLVASYLFYAAWKLEYLGLILLSTAVDYGVALAIGATGSRGRKRLFLAFSLAVNLGLLFVFKYFGFFGASLAAGLARLGLDWTPPETAWLLPVGISFYTFQTLAYTIDVYRGLQVPERNLGRFALYVAFFPQLVAGPIERSQRLLPQFRRETTWDGARVASGLRLMGWGFFKKLVIADRLAVMVDAVYGDVTAYGGFPLALATYAFAWQIYCDFSGYSDIAIGAARVLGYDLMLNFDRPYASRSVGEFWQRWHISLSTWFRDYLYIPLGGNRVSRGRWQANLMITFLVSGLWHGASWTFVAWGALHGLFLLAGIHLARPWRRLKAVTGLARIPRLTALFETMLTFHLVLLGWIFFRAESLADAAFVLRTMVPVWAWPWPSGASLGLGLGAWELGLALLAIALLEALQWLATRGIDAQFLDARPLWQRWAVYYALGLSILVFGHFGISQFIYFQF